MDAGKKARIARIVGFVCVSLALLNAAIALLVMVAEKQVLSGGRGLAIAASLFIVGMVNLARANRLTPPDA